MRKIDKIKNLKRANLIAERIYLKSKGLIIENDSVLNHIKTLLEHGKYKISHEELTNEENGYISILFMPNSNGEYAYDIKYNFNVEVVDTPQHDPGDRETPPYSSDGSISAKLTSIELYNNITGELITGVDTNQLAIANIEDIASDKLNYEFWDKYGNNQDGEPDIDDYQSGGF